MGLGVFETLWQEIAFPEWGQFLAFKSVRQ